MRPLPPATCARARLRILIVWGKQGATGRIALLAKALDAPLL